jgi:nucleoside-diphosphate-sugar epimerase
MPIRRVLITGASGFVGSHVADVLKSRGIAVRCLVRRTSRLDFIGPASPEIAYGDVTLPETLRPALEDVDGIVHCAGLTKARSAEDFFRVNQEGSRNLYLAGQNFRGRLLKIVHISSLAAMGPSLHGQPVTEESVPRPVSDYGRSKLAGQRIAESFMRELPVSILIPPAVYGPRDADFRTYFRLAARGIVPLPGRAQRFLSLIYVKDLAEAAVLTLTLDKSAGKTYIVEDGCVQTWRSVADAIDHALGRTSRRVYMPLLAVRTAGVLGDLFSRVSGKAVLLSSQKVGEFFQAAWTCSAQRIRDELGFRPSFSLERGFSETLAWYRQQTPRAFP